MIFWSEQMRSAIIIAATKGDTVNKIAKQMGVSRDALASGLLEIIRDDYLENYPFAAPEASA